ncbi:hypothetical protein JHK82_018551 [Glycine max]|nr:hypothetical protein JHK82_018551 [Glycine max]
MEIVHKKSNGKIVFAQGKDFADFLSSLLTIPLGGMLHLTEGCSSLGSVEGLYRSVVDFEEVIGLQRNISETANSKGYVEGPIMYMATDDLVVTLMSSISVISLLSSVCIHVTDLEEKVVNIGVNVVRREHLRLH